MDAKYIGFNAPAGGGPSSLLTGLLGGWKMDESSGSVAYDVLSANNLSVTGASFVSGGKPGGGYYLDYTSTIGQYAQTGSVPFSITDNTFSISFWINFDSIATGVYKYFVYYVHNSDPYWSFNFYYSSSNELIFAVHNSIGERYECECDASDVSLTTSTWYHMVGVCPGTGSALRMYINNAETYDIQQTLSGTLLSADSVFRAVSGTYGIDGKFDNLYIWNRNISSAEVSVLWNGGDGLAYPFS